MNVKGLLGGGALATLLGLNAVNLSGPEGAVATRSQAMWSLALPGVLTALTAPLGPDGRMVVATHTLTRLLLLDLDGTPVAERSGSRLAALATGDLEGDRRDELIVLTDSPARVTALGPGLRERWSAPVNLEWPSRVLPADLNGDGSAEIVVGSGTGVEAFSSTGRPLWAYRFPRAATGEAAELRGLDDVRVGRERRVAIGRRDGTLTLLGPDGAQLLERTYEGGLRRLRTTDMQDDHRGEILLGCENGTFLVLDADGATQFTTDLGEAVAELRRLDLDGHAATVELVLGGKRGAVQVENPRLGTMRRTSLPDKVTALGAVDLDGDGRAELALGDEAGHVQVQATDGQALLDLAGQGKIERLVALPEPGSGLRNAGTTGGGHALLVASANGLAVWRLRPEPAPGWYSSWTAGLLGLLGLGAVGLVMRRLRPVNAAPSPDNAHADAVQAARTQIESWISAGHLTPAQAAERLRQLARELEATPTPARASPPAPPRQT